MPAKKREPYKNLVSKVLRRDKTIKKLKAQLVALDAQWREVCPKGHLRRHDECDLMCDVTMIEPSPDTFERIRNAPPAPWKYHDWLYHDAPLDKLTPTVEQCNTTEEGPKLIPGPPIVQDAVEWLDDVLDIQTERSERMKAHNVVLAAEYTPRALEHKTDPFTVPTDPLVEGIVEGSRLWTKEEFDQYMAVINACERYENTRTFYEAVHAGAFEVEQVAKSFMSRFWGALRKLARK